MFIINLIDKIRNRLFLNVMRNMIHDEFMQSLLTVFANERVMFQELQNNQLRTTVVNEANHFTQIILGEMRKNISYTSNMVSRFISAALINRETFLPFKGYCKGKSLVVCGAGPSLQNYVPVENAVHIALNRAFLFDKVKFDFVFAQDFDGIKMVQQELIDYKGNNCVKLLGSQCDNEPNVFAKNIPISFRTACNAKNFITDIFSYSEVNNFFDCKFVSDIDSRAIGNFSNVGLSVMQFALYMQPDKLYIVGCDSSGNHFTSKGYTKEEAKTESDFMDNYWNEFLEKTRKKWEECKLFAHVYYPDTEIISVNPVGLKGIFKDWYQDEGEEPK